MKFFYMMVGLSGSGKSTWAKNNLDAKIFSSDEYREKMFGDVNDQSHNGQLFTALYKDLRQALLNDEKVVLDATNINRKDRKQCLDRIKDIPNVYKMAVVMATNVSTAINQNHLRERIVPTYVISNQLKRFEIPFYGEGFNEVRLVYNPSDNVRESYDAVCDKMEGFEQNNPHHTLTVGRHCDKCFEQVCKDYPRDINLLAASRIHDYGKLFTRSDDEQGISHYYCHENVGAYASLFINYDAFDSKVDPLKVAFYINYHMTPFQLLEGAKKEPLDFNIARFGEDNWKKLLSLHEADINAK